jgi:predicted metal-binding protein
MNSETITVNGREYTLHHSSVKIGVKELTDRYRDVEKFITYCKACNRYNACWSCPPFDFDTDAYLAAYQTAHIIGTKIILDKETIDSHQGWDNCTKISYEIIGTVRKELDNMLLSKEAQNPESKAFFAGTCRLCPLGQCTKITGAPCISPEKIRPSLEALGFNVSDISLELLNIEMKWSRNGILPEYFTLVSGFFNPHPIAQSGNLAKSIFPL